MELYKLDAFGNIYADAFIGTESNELLFVSLIGSQTEMRRLQSVITLGETTDTAGLTNLRGTNGEQSFILRIPNANQLGQHAGVISKTLFGDLVHLWVYNKTLLHNLDYSNGIGYFIVPIEQGLALETQIWHMIKALAEIPLLDEWQDCILKYGNRFYCYLNEQGRNLPCVGIKVDLSNGFTSFVEGLLKSGELAA